MSPERWSGRPFNSSLASCSHVALALAPQRARRGIPEVQVRQQAAPHVRHVVVVGGRGAHGLQGHAGQDLPSRRRVHQGALGRCCVCARARAPAAAAASGACVLTSRRAAASPLADVHGRLVPRQQPGDRHHQEPRARQARRHPMRPVRPVSGPCWWAMLVFVGVCASRARRARDGPTFSLGCAALARKQRYSTRAERGDSTRGTRYRDMHLFR